MSTTTSTTPPTIVEVHTLAGLLLATLGGLGYVVEYLTIELTGVGIQVDDPAGVAAFLGGLERIGYDVGGVHRYFFSGPWRGVSLHVGPLAA